MTLPRVSVVVVSHGRPDALLRCVTGVAQLDYPEFEIVVVADRDGLARIRAFDGRIRKARFDERNISAARNLGISLAAGEVVAFIDDDAVPEPMWLRHLGGAFADGKTDAATGYVLGRNGISYQWKARKALSDGTTTDLVMAGTEPRSHRGEPGAAIKTEGTNMAFRRTVLAGIGGFDPVYRFYLDETDLNMRLAEAGCQTAIVPLALVHHGFEASERRRADRVPTTLYEVGASHAAFLKRHAGGQDATAIRDAARNGQRVRLLEHMVMGRLEPFDVGPLLATFDRGWAEGEARPLEELAPIGPPSEPFLKIRAPFRSDHQVMTGRPWRKLWLRKQAARHVETGRRVTLFLFSPTLRRHVVRFRMPGFWEQSGGTFGASDRSDPVFRFFTFQARTSRELGRVAKARFPD